jgi:hypothetical protein
MASGPLPSAPRIRALAGRGLAAVDVRARSSALYSSRDDRAAGRAGRRGGTQPLGVSTFGATHFLSRRQPPARVQPLQQPAHAGSIRRCAIRRPPRGSASCVARSGCMSLSGGRTNAISASTTRCRRPRAGGPRRDCRSPRTCAKRGSRSPRTGRRSLSLLHPGEPVQLPLPGLSPAE